MPTKRGANTRSGTIENHPYEATLASIMLDAAVQSACRPQDAIRKALGYRTRSQISHYMTGIYAIPIAASERIAAEVGLDVSAFVVAVVRQRHAGIMDQVFVSAPFDDDELRAMRVRLNTEGRKAAIEILPLVNRPLDGPEPKGN